MKNVLFFNLRELLHSDIEDLVEDVKYYQNSFDKYMEKKKYFKARRSKHKALFFIRKIKSLFSGFNLSDYIEKQKEMELIYRKYKLNSKVRKIVDDIDLLETVGNNIFFGDFLYDRKMKKLLKNLNDVEVKRNNLIIGEINV